MTRITFQWNKYAACWESLQEKEVIYIHNYPPMLILVSIQKNEYIHASHEIFESLHAAHNYIGLKYNGEVKYRDPQEENHPRRELIDEYI